MRLPPCHWTDHIDAFGVLRGLVVVVVSIDPPSQSNPIWLNEIQPMLLQWSGFDDQSAVTTQVNTSYADVAEISKHAGF
jgi:hypothetical protein